MLNDLLRFDVKDCSWCRCVASVSMEGWESTVDESLGRLLCMAFCENDYPKLSQILWAAGCVWSSWW